MDKLVDLGYWGMFLSAFLAGSIIPANSEIVLSALLALGLNEWKLILFATLGNILGGISCYYIGYLGKIEWVYKYMRVKKEKFDKIHNFLDGKGSWIAFFVFLPFVGDIMIVVFGFMRSNPIIVFVSMSLGKLLKYIVWMYFTVGIIDLVT